MFIAAQQNLYITLHIHNCNCNCLSYSLMNTFEGNYEGTMNCKFKIFLHRKVAIYLHMFHLNRIMSIY